MHIIFSFLWRTKIYSRYEHIIVLKRSIELTMNDFSYDKPSLFYKVWLMEYGLVRRYIWKPSTSRKNSTSHLCHKHNIIPNMLLIICPRWKSYGLYEKRLVEKRLNTRFLPRHRIIRNEPKITFTLHDKYILFAIPSDLQALMSW